MNEWMLIIKDDSYSNKIYKRLMIKAKMVINQTWQERKMYYKKNAKQ